MLPVRCLQIWSIYNFSDSKIIRRFIEVNVENLDATHFFVDFPKVFDSVHSEKRKQILLVYKLSKETFTAMMKLCKKKKKKKYTTAVVRSLDSDSNFFDIVTGVL